MKLFWTVVLFSSLAILGQALTPSSFFTTVDRSRLKAVFEASISKSGDADLSSLHYAILGYKLLGETAPNAQDLCKKLEAKLDAKSVSSVSHWAAAAKELKCAMKPTADVPTLLKNVLSSSDSTVPDLYRALTAQTAFGVKVDSAALMKSVQAALKKDDSVSNLGYAFHIAAAVDGGADAAKALFAQVEDVIVQADEVDGKMLQFEGGLSVTSLVVTGAYKLGAKLGKAPAISKMQASKFANYFLIRKSVQTPKGGFNLMEALDTLTTNKYHIPVAVTLAGASSVSASNPKIQVKVTDLLGASLGKMDVSVDSAMRQSDGAVIMAKTKMTASASDATVFEVDMMASNPGRGFYELTVSATAVKADDRLAGNTGAMVLIKALGDVVVTGAEIGVAAVDQSTVAKLTTVSHPSKLAKILEADHHQKLVFKFTLEDKASKEQILAHQAFVRFYDAKSASEIIFVAEPDSKSVYQFDLDVGAKAKEFAYRNGKYEVHLIVGDAVISNPINWRVADVDLSFPSGGASDEDDVPDTQGKMMPEIRHLFRLPEQRPPAAVSNLFTLLCLAPIAVMFIGWMALGINVSSFPFSISALGFHGGLGAIFTLYYYFWLQLDMFTTIKYLIMVGLVTFLCGNSLLIRIAEKRKA